MEYIKKDNNLILRLDLNDEIIESILLVAKKENIKCARISGIGATNNFTIGLFDVATGLYHQKNFTGLHEITSLIGNLTTKDDEPYLHLHINCANQDHEVLGGHLNKAIIGATAEIFIHIIDIKVERKFDQDIKLNKIKF